MAIGRLWKPGFAGTVREVRWILGFAALFVACAEAPATTPPDASVVGDASIVADGGTATDGGVAIEDAGAPGDGGTAEDASATPNDGGRAPYDGGPEPTTRIEPRPGELTIVQLDLPVGATLRLGEAAIIVGPAGSIALLDLGNSNHDDDVRAAVRRLNEDVLTPANGFAARRPLQVEWLILTHYHGDHVGAFRDLTSGGDAIEITQGVVHRGFVDIGDAMNTNDYAEVCTALRGGLAHLDIPLCVAANAAPCDVNAATEAHAATSCPGLFKGDLATADDDVDALPSFIDLDGASIVFALADGHVSDGTSATAVPPFGHTDSNEENARSVGGVIAYEQFRYWFGGDLTGSGDSGEPDVETAVATTAVPAFLGEPGADVVHAHHHARRTSSNPAFVAAMAPLDGRDRNVVAGINAAHVGSPHDDVVAAWVDGGRLGRGAFWVTTSAPGGATADQFSNLVVAEGDVIIQTVGQGARYRVQAVGSVLQSRSFGVLR